MILLHPLALIQLLSACICIESDEQIFFVKSLVNMHHFFLFFSHQRDCDIYRNILCNSKIFQGNLGKVPSNPTSSPSSQPPRAFGWIRYSRKSCEDGICYEAGYHRHYRRSGGFYRSKLEKSCISSQEAEIKVRIILCYRYVDVGTLLLCVDRLLRGEYDRLA